MERSDLFVEWTCGAFVYFVLASLVHPNIE